jgi:uncharacterized protein
MKAPVMNVDGGYSTKVWDKGIDQVQCRCAHDARAYDQPLRFHLTHERPSKTVDIGHAGRSAALDPFGRVRQPLCTKNPLFWYELLTQSPQILQLNTFHPEHGIVLASPYEQFDGSRFYDVQYVREYRKKPLRSIANGHTGFGLRFSHSAQYISICWEAGNKVSITYALADGVSVEISSRIFNGELIQSAVLSSEASAVNIQYILDLTISINRASYGQLTEGGPIPIPVSENQYLLNDEHTSFAVVNPHLDTHLEGSLDVDGEPVILEDNSPRITRGKPIDATVPGWVEVHPQKKRTLTVRFRLYPDLDVRGKFDPILVPSGPLSTCACQGRWHDDPSTQISIPAIAKSERCSTDISATHSKTPEQCSLERSSVETFIIRRNLDYILGCLAVTVSNEHVALMTDHVALPLGWNRDN